MELGKTVRLFLVEGTATGILTAEIGNWTGHLLAAPRSKLAEALARDEAKRTGVYILTGDDPEIPNKTRVYVGEGDSVSERLKMHAANKEFWARAFIITSKDSNLTKAHVRYLENRLVQIAKSIGKATIDNVKEPSSKLLPEPDVADMEFFLSQIRLMLPVVGIDVFRAKPKLVPGPEWTGEIAFPATGPLELVLQSKKHGLYAQALESDGEVTVLKGSTASSKGGFVQNNYASLRSSLELDGSLISAGQEDLLEFSRDVAFPSPSAAAAVIFGRNANGRTAWKVVATGQTLKDWQDSQLADPVKEFETGSPEGEPLPLVN